MIFNDSSLYFFDREYARETALQNKMVLYHGPYYVRQTCYYDGAPFEDAPPHLINVPIERYFDIFSTTPLRFPQNFVTKTAKEDDKARMLVGLGPDIRKTRMLKATFFANIIAKHKPLFKNDRPWRILLPASRYTDVWQYCQKNLARAFQKRGCDARVFYEENDLYEYLTDPYNLLEEAVRFKPHIWVSISCGANDWLHPDLFHVIWWQDPRAPLGTGERINWRERDILFSQYRFVDDLLKRTGAKEINRQGIGADPDSYKLMPDAHRKRKVVFIGSSYVVSYKGKCSGYANNDRVIAAIERLFNEGLPITEETMAQLGSRYDIPTDVIYQRHANYVVRERIVEWLCQCKDIEVEVYGRYWEDNEIVMPFFKGELPYGEEVAKIYNEATYALSISTAEINTQRLAEMSACGCIPVVYDCRHHAEKPHWDNECLFFRTKEELYSCFNKKPSGSPLNISKESSYDTFADKILTMIQEREATSGL